MITQELKKLTKSLILKIKIFLLKLEIFAKERNVSATLFLVIKIEKNFQFTFQIIPLKDMSTYYS